MTTAAVAGRGQTVHVATSTGSPSYVAVGEITTVSPNLTRAFYDVSNADSGGYREKIAGFADGNFTFSCNYVPSGDAGQTIVLDARESGAKIAFRYRGEVAGGSDEWLTLVVLVTDTSFGGDVDAGLVLNATVEVSGSSARSAQP